MRELCVVGFEVWKRNGGAEAHRCGGAIVLGVLLQQQYGFLLFCMMICYHEP